MHRVLWNNSHFRCLLVRLLLICRKVNPDIYLKCILYLNDFTFILKGISHRRKHFDTHMDTVTHNHSMLL